MQIENKMEKFLKLIILAIAAAGIILRFNGLSSRSLEYDEIWTFAHYVKIQQNIKTNVCFTIFPQNDMHFTTKLLFSKLNKHNQNNYSKIVSTKN